MGMLLIGLALVSGCFRPNSSPTAIFTCDHSSGHSPFTVQFDASLSYDSDGKIVSYKWDFGNGETVNHYHLKTASTQYVTDVTNTYVVTLTVVDNNGGEGSTEVSITVLPPEPEVNLPPVAKFTCDSLSGTSPLLIHVDASASYDPDGEIVLYDWDFGNGDSDSYHYVKTASTLYITDTARTYTITLTVTDDDGAQATATKTISVEPEPQPTAEFEIIGWEQNYYESLQEYGLVRVNYRVTNTSSLDIDYYKVWFEVRCADRSKFQEWTNGLDVRVGKYLTDYTYIDTMEREAVAVSITDYELKSYSY